MSRTAPEAGHSPLTHFFTFFTNIYAAHAPAPPAGTAVALYAFVPVTHGRGVSPLR